MNTLFLIGFFLISACSSPKLEPSRSEKYFAEWSNDFYIENKPFQNQYKKYLQSVEDFFLKEEQLPKYEAYLGTTTNFFQLLAHSEFNLPTLYRRLKGPRADLRSRMYDDFKNRNLSQQYEKLNRDRESKLKEELGYELFEKLKVHYQKLGPYTRNT